MRQAGTAGWLTTILVSAVIISSTVLVPPAYTEDAEIPHGIISVSAGAIHETFTDAESETGVSIGVEYEYRASRLWGVGALVELTTETRDVLVAVPVSLHFYGSFRVLAAPAVEFGEPKVAAFRLGLGYDWDLSPRHNIGLDSFVDFLEDGRRSFVLAFSFGSIH